MLEPSKKTMIGMSVGTLMAITSAIYVFSGHVQAVTYQVAANVVSIRSLEVRAVNNEVADLKAERRKIRREQRQFPDNPDLMEDLEEIEDELVATEKVQECMTKEETKVCK